MLVQESRYLEDGFLNICRFENFQRFIMLSRCICVSVRGMSISGNNSKGARQDFFAIE
jgi:hypothetical protein